MNKKELIEKWRNEIIQRESLLEKWLIRSIKTQTEDEIKIISSFLEDLQQLNEDIRVPPEKNDSLPFIELAEELWDEYSEWIGTDITELEYWAGKTAIGRSQFIKAICSMDKGNASKT